MAKYFAFYVFLAAALFVALCAGCGVNGLFGGSLVEMQMVYEENPAFYFKEMKLLWDGTVYYVVPMQQNSRRGKEIGYAKDEFSTWRIFELMGYGIDYLLAVESDDVWRVMSSHAPKAPMRQYILEDAPEQKFLKTRSFTLYEDGTAVIAESPVSSYAFVGPHYYVFADGELLIKQADGSTIIVFDVADENTIVFKEAFVPLRADKGARYVAADLESD